MKKCRAKGRATNASTSRADQGAPESRKYRQTTNCLGENQEVQENYSLYTIGKSKSDPYCLNMKLNGQELKIEVDTEASVTVISAQTFPQTLKPGPKI